MSTLRIPPTACAGCPGLKLHKLDGVAAFHCALYWSYSVRLAVVTQLQILLLSLPAAVCGSGTWNAELSPVALVPHGFEWAPPRSVFQFARFLWCCRTSSKFISSCPTGIQQYCFYLSFVCNLICYKIELEALDVLGPRLLSWHVLTNDTVLSHCFIHIASVRYPLL